MSGGLLDAGSSTVETFENRPGGIDDVADRVDAGNIERLIGLFAELTEPGDGITRLAYSDLERQAHRLFADEMTRLGLTVTVDAVGNSIAELSSNGGGSQAIGTGSHLDSVPSGGRFDGTAGVCAGIEAARVVVESKIPRTRPWRFVAFAAEEGARFGQACNGSRVIAGLTTASDFAILRDADGISMAEAMTAVGLKPATAESARWSPENWLAFIELHIEQGNVLETQNTPIGIVDVISGSSRLMINLRGTASHTGGTPMHLRHDALVAASECVLAGERLSTDPEHHGTRITVGRLEVRPGSITTIPGQVTFSVDIRDLDSQRQRETAMDLVQLFESVAARRRVEIEVSVLGDTSPVVLPVSLVNKMAGVARSQGLDYRVMASGASHDSQQISRVTPTGMIFVPSHNGLSHVPEEWTSFNQIAAGTRVLIATLAALDTKQNDDDEGAVR